MNQKGDVTIIAVGNPGAGKSAFINSLAGEVVFDSGINIGQGLTYELNQVDNKNGYKALMDTPGLADVKLRKKAGEAISQGLRSGGKFVVIFFVTQQDGRVSQEDTTTMKLILQAAPEIGQNYGVIVNKVGKGVMKRLAEERKKYDFINALFAALDEKDRCIYENVLFFGNQPELEEEDNVLVSPDTLRANGVKAKGVTLQSFIDYLVDTAAVTITKDKVSEVDVEKYDELKELVANLQRQMDAKEKEWKQEKMEMERERSKEKEANLQRQLDAKEEELRQERMKLEKEKCKGKEAANLLRQLDAKKWHWKGRKKETKRWDFLLI